MNALLDAIEDRRRRAIGVAATYIKTDAGSQCWVVTHPDEPDRSYVVDMANRTCNCPDFVCRARGMEIDCKHILAVAPEWERETSSVLPARTQTLFAEVFYCPTKSVGLIGVRVNYDPQSIEQFRWIGGKWDRSRYCWTFPATGATACQLRLILPFATFDERVETMRRAYQAKVDAGVYPAPTVTKPEPPPMPVVADPDDPYID